MWEDRDLVVLEEDSGFGGPGCYRSVDTACEEEGARVLEYAPIAEGGGAVESPGVKVTRPEVFVEVLRDKRRFLRVNWSSVDKV